MKMVVLLLFGLIAGCATSTGSTQPSSKTSELTIGGDNTEQRFILDTSQTITSDEADQILADQEMCYLTLDNVTIECFPFGSLMMMGPDDAVELVFDNPLDDLHAATQDPKGELLLQTLSVVGMIGDSVERLPDAIADYLDGDDPANPGVATTLAHRLIDSEKISIPAMSRAGPFTVVLELTDDGKETLRQALADRESGDVRLVHRLHRRVHPRGITKRMAHEVSPTAAKTLSRNPR